PDDLEPRVPPDEVLDLLVDPHSADPDGDLRGPAPRQGKGRRILRRHPELRPPEPVPFDPLPHLISLPPPVEPSSPAERSPHQPGAVAEQSPNERAPRSNGERQWGRQLQRRGRSAHGKNRAPRGGLREVLPG